MFRDSALANNIAKANMTAILEQNSVARVRSFRGRGEYDQRKQKSEIY